MAAKDYSNMGIEIREKHCESELNYSLSLDELDISFSTISKLLRRRNGEVLPLWDIDACFRKEEVYNSVEDDFCEFEISAVRVADEDTKDSFRKPYFCYICNIEIPKTCINKHMQSDNHRILLKLANTALERVNKHISQQINVGLRNKEQSNTDLNMFYCVSCNILMEETLKENHEIQNNHKISKRRAQFMAKLFEIYTEEIDKYDIHKESDKDTVIQTKKALKTDKITPKDTDVQNLLKPNIDIKYTKANTSEYPSQKSINILKDTYLYDTCNVEVPYNSQNISEHVNGKNHRNKMNEGNPSNKDIHENNIKSDKLNVSINIFKDAYLCDLCNVKVPYNSQNISEHINGKNHRNKMNEGNPSDKDIHENNIKSEKLSVDKMAKSNFLSEKNRIVDKLNETIKICTLSGEMLKIPKLHWHGIATLCLNRNSFCRICEEEMPIDLIETHIESKNHKEHLNVPIANKHGFRKISESNIMHCIVCNSRFIDLRQSLENHVLTPEHHLFLEQALIYANDEPTIISTKGNHESSISETEKINCDICNINLSKTAFNYHVNGKKHLKKLNNFQIRNKITSKTEVGELGSTINAENMKIENKEKETANYSKSPHGVVLKREKFKVVEIDEHNIQVTAMNGDVVRINKNNWHSIIRMEKILGNKRYGCQLCHYYEPVEQLEKHIRWSYHTDLIESPVPDKHCLRQNYHNEIYCTICQKIVFMEGCGSMNRKKSKQQGLDDHISSVEHQDLLKKALLFSNDITSENLSEENIFSAIDTGITNCKICNMQLVGKNAFESHVHGKKHQKNIKKLQNSDKITNKTENDSLGTTINAENMNIVNKEKQIATFNAENMNIANKEKEIAKFSRNPHEVVLKRGKFEVIDFDEHNVEVTTMNGDVIRINKDNWHSTIRMESSGDELYYCQLCDDYEPIEHLEKHIRSSHHIDLVESPVPDKHCLRQNYKNEIFCTICQETIFKESFTESNQLELDDHISSVNHQDLLKQALVLSNDITTKNQTDEENFSEENIGVSAIGTDITNCEICNMQLCTRNAFESHVHGKEHQKNVEKLQNSDKLTNKTEEYYTICQETVLKESFSESKQLELDDHISNVDHQDFFKQALVFSNDITTKNQTSKENVTEEYIGTSTSRTDVVNSGKNWIKIKNLENGNKITNKADVSESKVEIDREIQVKESVCFSRNTEDVTNKGQYKVRDIDEDNVAVIAMNGDVVIVSKDNWHSIIRGKTYFYCKLCDFVGHVEPVNQIQEHIRCPEHTDLIESSVIHKHCFRQNKGRGILCIICCEYAFDKTNLYVSMQQLLNEHVLSERHQKFLAKALMYSANDDLGTKNQSNNRVPQDELLSAPDSCVIKCDVCNVNVSKLCYSDHINGKRHQKKVNKVNVANKDMKTVALEVAKQGPELAKTSQERNYFRTVTKINTAQCNLKKSKGENDTLSVNSKDNIELITHNGKNFCKICKTKIANPESFNEHYKGKNHARKLELYFKNNNSNNKSESDHYCSVCKKNIAESDMNSHFKSAEHKKANGAHFCLVCNVEVHQNNMNVHVKGKAHKLCAAKLHGK